MMKARMLVDVYAEPVNGQVKRLKRWQSYSVVNPAYRHVQNPDPRHPYGSVPCEQVGVWVQIEWLEVKHVDGKEQSIYCNCQIKILFEEFETTTDN